MNNARIFVIGNDSAVWRALRDLGAPIKASWIDRHEFQCDHRDLDEIAESTSCVAYGELVPQELLALGAAIGRGIPVYLVNTTATTGPQAVNMHKHTRNVHATAEKLSAATAPDSAEVCQPLTGARLTLDVAIKLASKV